MYGTSHGQIMQYKVCDLHWSHIEKGRFSSRYHDVKVVRKAKHAETERPNDGQSCSMDERRKDNISNFSNQALWSLKRHDRQGRETGHLIIVHRVITLRTGVTDKTLCTLFQLNA